MLQVKKKSVLFFKNRYLLILKVSEPLQEMKTWYRAISNRNEQIKRY